MSNLWLPGQGGEQSAAGGPLGALGNINTEGPRGQITSVTTALTDLKSALSQTAWYSVGNSINSMLMGISDNAKKAAEELGNVNTAVGRTSSGSTGNASAPSGSGGNPNWLSTATTSAAAATAAAGGGAAPGAAIGGGMAPSQLDYSSQVLSQGRNLSARDLMKSMALFPLRFMRSNIEMNRGNALTASAALGMQGYATGVSNADQMTMLSRLPGNVRGSQADILSLFANAPQFGAMFGMGAQPNAPRAAGYLESVRQMQAMNPGAPVAELAGTVGGFASNTAAQQQSQMMTGGAFGMIRPGGGMKTIQEWAESILRWLEGLRGGGDRGKAFTYGDLIAQYFPGSNIDAWFDVQGVPMNMREYFWTYALGKTKGGGGTTDPMQQIGPDTKSIAYQRLAATTSMTQSQFKLGGQMAGAYANREQANRWFNDLLGSFINKVIPSAVSQGAMQYAQYLPDTVEQILMTILENTGTAGSLVGAYVGYGANFGGGGGGGTNFSPSTVIPGGPGAAGGVAEWFTGGAWPNSWPGDVPDIGDQYTTTGGTGTAGLHPDMRRRVDAMMKVNPKLRVNSGLRDNAMQQRLKRRGVGRVSGRPSAHTRGMAADLGPTSEYGWIVNNASKFGLNSGNSHGEPWHVGMGDMISDFVSGGGAFLGNLFSGLKNLFTGSDPASGVAGMITPFFELLGGLMSSGQVDPSKLGFQSDVYDRMHGLTAGGVSLGGGIQASIQGAASWLTSGTPGSAPGGGLAGGGSVANDGVPAAPGGGTLRQFFTQVLQELGAPATDLNLAKLGAVAKIEGNNSGTFNPFNSKGGDFPNKFNSQGVENYPDWETGVDWTVRLLSQDNHRWRANLVNSSSYEDFLAASREFYGRWNASFPNVNQSNAVAMLSHPVGMGDMEEMSYASMMPTAPAAASPSPVTFNNTFTIGGGVGGGGGIDLRRTVSTIADHLETEMKQRMVRMN